MHYGHYAAKNTACIVFPEILDLTPFTTSGRLSLSPSVPISTPPPVPPRSTTPTPASYGGGRVLYRLASVVCHFGQHSYGHYVCYRRKPRIAKEGFNRWAPPCMIDSPGCECELCQRFGPIREEHGEGDSTHHGGWLRISDEKVEECGIEQVLAEGSGAFMLYYERVVHGYAQSATPGSTPYALSQPVDIMSPRSSEETLKPILVDGNGNGHAMSTSSSSMNGSTFSLASSLTHSYSNGDASSTELRKPRVIGPRIVRSVAAGRGRSSSAAPSELEGRMSPASSSTSGSPPTVITSEPQSLTPTQPSTTPLSLLDAKATQRTASPLTPSAVPP